MAASTGTTATAAGTSPLRRSLVWSQNTSYPGAIGIHSEVSRKTQAQQATGQRQLDSDLTAIQSIHRKQLRSLSQHRKSMETSMLAYTQKMRKISSDRLVLAGLADSPAAPKDPFLSSSEAELGTSPGALERLVTLNKDRNESVHSKSPGTKKSLRDSVDSGIDLTEAGAERKISEERLFHVVRRSPPDQLAPDPKRRPASFHTIDSSFAASSRTTARPSTDRHNKAASGPSSLDGRSRQRQRRPGTAEKPDVASLQLSNGPEAGESSRNRNDPSPAAEDSPDFILAITPFPEFDCSQVLPLPHRGSRPNRFPLVVEEPAKKKSQKTREVDYWSYRRSPQRRSISVAGPLASPRRPSQDLQKSTPRQAFAGRPSQPRKAPRPPPPPPKKTYYLPFRYSDAVDNVMRSFEDRPTGTAIRRVSEALPTLDIDDLQSQRSRWSEDVARGPRGGPALPRANYDLNDGSSGHGLSRERSMSAPVGMDFVHGESYAIEEEVEEEEEDEDEEGQELEEGEEVEEMEEEGEEKMAEAEEADARTRMLDRAV